METQIVSVDSAARREASRELRYTMLRAPWNQPLEPDAVPPLDDLLAEHDGIAVGTGRLFPGRTPKEALLRGMSVRAEYRRLGIGQSLLTALEDRARGRGCDRLVANARTVYLRFYLDHGFRDIGDGPKLFDAIPHRRIEKPIAHDDFRRWSLTLRSATDTDGPRLQNLIFRCLAEFGMQPEQDGIDRDLEAICASYEGGAFWVLESADKNIAASVAMLPLGGRTYELRRMYLDANYRQSGIGRALLGLALNWAYRKKAHRIELETATSLEAARQLYLWAGFKRCEGELETQRCDQRMAMDLV